MVSLEQELSLTRREIENAQHSLHVLKAEWEHLNNPARLQKLAQKYLNVIPLDPTHYISLSQIPFREDAIVSFVTDTLEEEGILKTALSFNQQKG